MGLDNYYSYCCECGRLVPNEELHYLNDDDNEGYCDSCWHSHGPSQTVQSYYYKPEPIFYGEGKCFMGVELEIDEGGESNPKAQIMNIANMNGLEQLYVKHDGSLDDGIQMAQWADRYGRKDEPKAVLDNAKEDQFERCKCVNLTNCDSYVAVQLIEREGELTAKSLKVMAEVLEGTFTFTVLDGRNNLCFVKGNNPLTICLLPNLGCYIYASTKEILDAALAALGLAAVSRTTIAVSQGDIMQIDGTGRRFVSRFDDTRLNRLDYYSGFGGWHRPIRTCCTYKEDDYLEEVVQ